MFISATSSNSAQQSRVPNWLTGHKPRQPLESMLGSVLKATQSRFLDDKVIAIEISLQDSIVWPKIGE